MEKSQNLPQEISWIWAKISEILPPAWRIGAVSLKSPTAPLFSFSFQLSQRQDTRELWAATETQDLPQHVTDPRTVAGEIGLPSICTSKHSPETRTQILDSDCWSARRFFPTPSAQPFAPPRPFTAIKANKESQLCTEMAAAQTRVQLWPYRRGDNLQQKGESFSPWPDLTELIWKLTRQSRHSVTGCCQDLRQKPQPSNQLPVDRCRELNFQWRATEAQSLTGTLISQITFIPEVCINSLAIEPLYKLKIAF